MTEDARHAGIAVREQKRGCPPPLLARNEEGLIRAARCFLRRVGS
jgi:hypothetical protein